MAHRNMQKLFKTVFDFIGIGGFARQSLVETRLMGERAKFTLTGRPEPNSSILLVGSGRSGTTWITDVLCALPGTQQIFEPLFPLWNETVLEITGWDKRDPYSRSIYLRSYEDYPAWEYLWQKILTGEYRNYWTDYERNSYFPDRFIIKEVRANMMLGYIYRYFQPRIVYIMRHPCAVVHSRLVAPKPWHADIRDILAQEKLLVDYLHPWVAMIEKEKDLLGAHAVWWAVENLVALKQLETIPHFRVYFEDLVLRPQEVLDSLLPWLGYNEIPTKLFSRLSWSSRMSNEKIVYQNKQDRISRWQHGLLVDDQNRILAWGERLGLSIYDKTLIPKERSSAYAS